MEKKGLFGVEPRGVFDQSAQIEQNLDAFIDEWGSDLREQWAEKGHFEDDFKGMFRTALITICRVRESRAAAEKSHLEFANLKREPQI